MVPSLQGKVLDVGCSNGAFGESIRRDRGVEVWGIELDDVLAREAEGRLDRVFRGDAAEELGRLVAEGQRFHLVVFADCLEHLKDPWGAYDLATKLVAPKGLILVSLPNIAHWDTFANLLRGRWPRRDRGLFDDTHLRFFAYHNVIELMGRGGSLVELQRVYRLIERPHRLNRWAHLLAWLWPNLLTYQYLALAQVGPEREKRKTLPSRTRWPEAVAGQQLSE
jgi:2-polyprenyl-3-methyl-5-hydroxy-6-metoxy-1,4-benzoquinol methylase